MCVDCVVFPVLCGEWIEFGGIKWGLKYGFFGSGVLGCSLRVCCMERGGGESGVVGVVYCIKG